MLKAKTNMKELWLIPIVVILTIISAQVLLVVEGALISEKCVQSAYPPSPKCEIPHYNVNLNLPPQERWTEVVKQKKDDIASLLSLFKKASEHYFHGFIVKLVDFYFPKMAKTLPYPFYDELVGISDASGLPLGEITFLNLFYEILTACTSIIAQDNQGRLYHARNLDFGSVGWNSTIHMWEGTLLLQKLAVVIDFQKNEKSLFKSVQFAGYIGILTAVKQNMFSLSVNSRFKLEGGYIGVIEWILGYRTGNWIGFLSRAIFENATSYSQAQKILAKSELLAPVYFILGGAAKGQACVITRSFKTADIWTIGTKESTWFMVETNYDHWTQPPPSDNRRNVAIGCMNKLTQQNATLPGLFNVLSTYPVRDEITVYTALIQVNDGHLETYLQQCPNP